MKGNPRVIEYLNKALTHELTAVNQYWLHYRLLDDWGFTRLAKKEREESIEEMKHADKVIEDLTHREAPGSIRETKDLWDMPFNFLLVLVLASGEWFIRKRKGLA